MRFSFFFTISLMLITKSIAQSIKIDSLIALDKITLATSYLATRSAKVEKYSLGQSTIYEYPELGIMLKTTAGHSYFDFIDVSANGKSSLYGLGLKPLTSFKDALKVFSRPLSVKIVVSKCDNGVDKLILSDAKMFEFSLEFNAKTRLKNNIITEYTVDSTNYFEFYDAKLVRLKCETGVSISMISSENTAYSVDNTVEYKSRLRQAWELSKEGRNEEALLSFIQLQKDFPENSSAHYFEGYIHTRLGHFDKAIKAYEKSLKLPSDNYTNKFSIMLNLMELYLLTGQRLKVESMEKVIYKDGKSRERFLATFLVHINTKVAGKRDGNREKELRDAVKYLNLKSLNWNFNEILTWLKDSSATELSKKYVASWIENLTVRTD